MQNNDIGIDPKNLAGSPYFWGFLIGFILTQLLAPFAGLLALVLMALALKFTKLYDEVGSGLLGIVGAVAGLIYTSFSLRVVSILFLIVMLVVAVKAKKESNTNHAIMVDVAGGMILIQIVLTLLTLGTLFLGKR